MPSQATKIFRERASAVIVHEGRLLTVRLQDPVTNVSALYVPGGGIEPGESPGTCAVRETLEETGYSVILDLASERIARYDFTWNGHVHDCVTHFFRGELSQGVGGPRRVTDAVYNLGTVWLPLGQVREELGFHTVILDEVLAVMLRDAPSGKV